MNDQDPEKEIDPYLWDGTGTPDPDVARLEKSLGLLRHRSRLPALPPRAPAPRIRIMTTLRPWLAAAAALVVITTVGWFALSSTAWSVRALSGVPAVAGRGVIEQGKIAPGEWLVTDASARARVAVGSIGSVDVDPNTRVQLVTTGGREHRMALERGTIHARIWAPPKFFYVNTEAAVAVDLGCAYTLQVDSSGTGLLRVTHGWVGFEREGRDTYVPEGAVCVTRADKGPGTPRYEDAPSGYGVALMLLDFGPRRRSGTRRRARPGALDRSSPRRHVALAPAHAWFLGGARARLRPPGRARAAPRGRIAREDPERRQRSAQPVVGPARDRSLDVVAVVQEKMVYPDPESPSPNPIAERRTPNAERRARKPNQRYNAACAP